MAELRIFQGIRSLTVDPLSGDVLSYGVDVFDLRRFPIVRSGCVVDSLTRATGCEMVSLRRGEVILSMSPDEAREMARVLLAAADLADGAHRGSGR